MASATAGCLSKGAGWACHTLWFLALGKNARKYSIQNFGLDVAKMPGDLVNGLLALYMGARVMWCHGQERSHWPARGDVWALVQAWCPNALTE